MEPEGFPNKAGGRDMGVKSLVLEARPQGQEFLLMRKMRFFEKNAFLLPQICVKRLDCISMIQRVKGLD